MSQGERIRNHVRVHGQVQGVFFRDRTRERAESLGVAGWVRNCPDGTVEAVFEGELEPVRTLVEFCRSGPGRAQVEWVESDERPPEGISGFQVR